jgi:hypothetical protein
MEEVKKHRPRSQMDVICTFIISPQRAYLHIIVEI